MDYREKYEQALENLKRIKKANRDNKELVDFIEYQYPELKESEDDKRILNILRSMVHGTYEVQTQEMVDELLSWLESIKPQNTWKPSNEQMQALANACDGKVLNLDYLNLLYQDLKKLKGE